MFDNNTKKPQLKQIESLIAQMAQSQRVEPLPTSVNSNSKSCNLNNWKHIGGIKNQSGGYQVGFCPDYPKIHNVQGAYPAKVDALSIYETLKNKSAELGLNPQPNASSVQFLGQNLTKFTSNQKQLSAVSPNEITSGQVYHSLSGILRNSNGPLAKSSL